MPVKELTLPSEKFKELQDKDPRELVEDAKEFARQKPGQTILDLGSCWFGCRFAFATRK